MKTCTNLNCKQVNPQSFDSFYKDERRKNGLTGRCIKCTNEQTGTWAAKNPEKVQASKDKWRLNNLEKHAENAKKWKKENKGKANAITRKRQAAKLQRTPKWLTKEHLKAMSDIYTEAAKLTKETGIRHEVDHIEPMQGKAVSGLHVPWNLQIMPRSMNRKKGNKRSL